LRPRLAAGLPLSWIACYRINASLRTGKYPACARIGPPSQKGQNLAYDEGGGQAMWAQEAVTVVTSRRVLLVPVRADPTWLSWHPSTYSRHSAPVLCKADIRESPTSEVGGIAALPRTRVHESMQESRLGATGLRPINDVAHPSA
jgi:hypothetical protein